MEYYTKVISLKPFSQPLGVKKWKTLPSRRSKIGIHNIILPIQSNHKVFSILQVSPMILTLNSRLKKRRISPTFKKINEDPVEKKTSGDTDILKWLWSMLNEDLNKYMLCIDSSCKSSLKNKDYIRNACNVLV